MTGRLAGVLRRAAGVAALLLAAAAAAPAAARGQDVTICADQPVPQGYAVVGAGKGSQCPGYYAPGINVVTLRVPGDTITVCTGYTTSLDGYVVTGRGKHSQCPGYYAPGSNGATFRRLPQAYPGPGPAPATDGTMMTAWGPYSREVMGRLRVQEDRLMLDEPTHQPWLGLLAGGATVRMGVELESGVPHTLVVVCDQDCSGMALRVVDPRGAAAAATAGATPLVIPLPPAISGRWTLEASLRGCAADSCRFAVGVYETPEPGPPVVDAPTRPSPIRPRPQRP